MKRPFLTIILTILTLAAFSDRAFAQQSDTYFPYPVVPEEKTTLSERCNFLVDHFWERCNLKQSFSSLDRLDKAFNDWVGFMPYATTDTIYMAIDNYLADIAKTGPKNLVTVAKMAEKHMYSDSAEIFSEELYLPFCKAVSENKKVDKNDRAYFDKQYKILSSSGLGRNIPDFVIVNPDGSTQNFKDIIASRIVLMIGDPDQFDTSLAKARLAADYNLSQLIEQGLVKVVFLYPNAPTPEWQKVVESYPEKWIVGAFADAGTMFDLSSFPKIFYLDPRHKILGKDVPVDNLLVALRQINKQIQN